MKNNLVMESMVILLFLGIAIGISIMLWKILFKKQNTGLNSIMLEPRLFFLGIFGSVMVLFSNLTGFIRAIQLTTNEQSNGSITITLWYLSIYALITFISLLGLMAIGRYTFEKVNNIILKNENTASDGKVLNSIILAFIFIFIAFYFKGVLENLFYEIIPYPKNRFIR